MFQHAEGTNAFGTKPTVLELHSLMQPATRLRCRGCKTRKRKHDQVVGRLSRATHTLLRSLAGSTHSVSSMRSATTGAYTKVRVVVGVREVIDLRQISLDRQLLVNWTRRVCLVVSSALGVCDFSRFSAAPQQIF